MRLVLAAPLLPSTLAGIVVALAVERDPLDALVLGVALAAALAVLAVASVDRRRLAWATAAVVSVLVAAHGAFPIALIPPDLLTFGAPRDLLARPIELLVPAPESALLLGIVLGERADIPPGLSRAFAASGTTHLLAISGFNMTLVATAVALALRGRASPATRAVAAVAAIVLYSILVGLSASVLRAALMSGVAACGVVSGRRAATANALCAAVTLMLVADPRAVGDVGLQLSALATAGLVLFQVPLSNTVAFLPTAVGEGIATTVAATVPTLPVVAAVFGRVSLVSVAANLVCVPLFPLLMLAGAATSLAGAMSIDAARPVALIAWASAYALRVGVETFASLPLASLTVPSGLLTGAFVAALEICAIAVGPRIRAAARGVRLVSIPRRLRDAVGRMTPPPATRVRGMSLALAILLVAAPAAVAATWPAASRARVIALDVGQGDAYLVELGGPRLLIDGGPDPARVLEELAATLAPWDRRIDAVALTHAHADHGAGLIAVLGHYEVALAIEPVGLNPSVLTDEWIGAVAKSGAERRAVRAGQRFQLGDATISVLAPDPDVAVDVPSLVLRVERGAFSALFSGDVMDDALARLLDRPERLRSRIYVPPHHGAATPYAASMRAAAHPDAALISVGAGNRYGHPTPQTLAALRGVPTYRTDQDGTVEIALDGTGLVVRTHANALPPPRRGSIPYSPSGG